MSQTMWHAIFIDTIVLESFPGNHNTKKVNLKMIWCFEMVSFRMDFRKIASFEASLQLEGHGCVGSQVRISSKTRGIDSSR